MNKYISFDTAKLLKEKGYLFPSQYYWANYYQNEPTSKWKFIHHTEKQYDSMEHPALMLCDIQEWLRDRSIIVEVLYEGKGKYSADVLAYEDASISLLKGVNIMEPGYLMALNIAVHEAVKMLKSKE